MGNPGQRVPVGGVDLGKRPDNPLERQSPGNFRVFIHVIIVVVIDKVMPQRLAEDQPCDHRQKNADRENRPAIIQADRSAFGFRRQESANSGISPVGETGAPECMAGAFPFDLRLIYFGKCGKVIARIQCKLRGLSGAQLGKWPCAFGGSYFLRPHWWLLWSAMRHSA